MTRLILASLSRVLVFGLVPVIVLVFGLGLGCGKSAAPAKTKDDAAAGPTAAPLAMPPLGVDQIKRFNYIYEAGSPAEDKAIAAYRKKDWATVRAQTEAALAKDATHLGAHRLLAAALIQTGEPAAAVDHLVTAIAADYLQFAPTLTDEDLKDFMASPHGQSVKALTAQIHDEYAKRIASGLWLVGRRSPFKWPKDLGVQVSTSRGELYAFDRETKRFFRLTHTDHQVVGFVRPASGNEVAVIGFDKIDRPRGDAGKPDSKDGKDAKDKPITRPDGGKADAAAAAPEAKDGKDGKDGKPADDVAPLFAQPWLQVFDTTEWKQVTPRIKLPSAREVSVGYAAGDQLLVATAQSTGRWTVGEPAVSSVDRSTGKLTKVTTPIGAPMLVVSPDEGHLVRIPDGVTATWAGPPAVTSSFTTAGGKPIQVPESGAATQASIALSSNGAYIAFATAVDPCAKDAAPSLYVAEAKTAALKHVLSAKSRFATRWADVSALAYEDGDGAIRLWDAAAGREVMRVENKAGIALDVLSLADAPLCKQAPPTVDAAGASDEPLPPEEPSGSAAPQ